MNTNKKQSKSEEWIQPKELLQIVAHMDKDSDKYIFQAESATLFYANELFEPHLEVFEHIEIDLSDFEGEI
ncbi:MAG: hypothetical protein EAZ55_02255 [Cytophagales bacterium]|nr:MAG: hypothetical protein EAZ55_02255 [Cytophagales bacterium]